MAARNPVAGARQAADPCTVACQIPDKGTAPHGRLRGSPV